MMDETRRAAFGSSFIPHPSSLVPHPSSLKLVVEKVPLLAIAGLFCLLAVHGQEAETLAVNQEYSFPWRIGNALVSYVFHLGKLFYPVDLAVIYPRVRELPPGPVVGSSLLLAAVTAAAVVWRRSFPNCWSVGSGIWG